MSRRKSKLLVSLCLLFVLTLIGNAVYLGGMSPGKENDLLLGWGSIFLTAGLFVSLFIALRHRYERRLNEVSQTSAEGLRQMRELADLHLSAIESLAVAIDAKDQTTHGHVRRTQVYALELGKLLNVSAQELEALKAGALLHDVGKLAVPEYILNKPGKLTAAEFEKMKIHTVVGGDIIRGVNFPYPVEDIVRFHHEKWDGTGYPNGLKGEQIPLVARVTAVVDFYDTTRCDRPYRPGMSREESLAMLRRMAGHAFDPTVVEMFVRHIDQFDGLIAEQDLREQVQRHGGSLSFVDEHQEPDTKIESANSGDHRTGFRTIAEAQREVFALHEIAQTLGSSLDLQDTVALVAEKLRAIVPFDTCVIFAVDEKSGRAAPIFSAGERSEFFSERSIQVGEGITGWVIANARPMCDTPPELDLVGVPGEIAGHVRCVISAPLFREDGSFGAITLYSARADAYTSDHVRLLESVCLHASSALNNALTFERTKQTALLDPLTDLPNARALHFLLEQRIAERRRSEGEHLAVLSLDVDCFNEINSEFGHGVGDRLLASAADVIKGQLRQMDVLARYSGDEFIAVMPSATHEAASMAAERIRSAVESCDFTVKTGRTVRVGVSVGVGCYPEDGETADELLLAATQNMQRNKDARKISPGSAASAPVVSLDAFR